MVRPGVQIRNPRLNELLHGRRRALRVYLAAHFVDDRGRIVLLGRAGQAGALIENDALLMGRLLLLFRLWNRGDELGAPTIMQKLLSRLPGFIQLPVPGRALVGGIQNGVVKERIGHRWDLRAVCLRIAVYLRLSRVIPCPSPSPAGGRGSEWLLLGEPPEKMPPCSSVKKSTR